MISIIIPILNQHEMTEECIMVVRENTEDYELVLIDNGSSPPIHKPFTGFVETILIRNETNLGFPVAVNQGIRAAKGDVIVLLNNDVVVTPGWAERLLDHLETYSIVAPMANYCAGLQQEIILAAYDNIEELNDRVAELAEERKGESIEVNYVMGFCMAFRKSLFDEIGSFDESLWPCCGEEIDFCFRAREAGHKIGVAQDAYVHHVGSVTLTEMERNGQGRYLEICEKNNIHLAKKWGYDFWLRQVGPYKKENPEVSGNGALRLNLGCGQYPLPGFINIDQFENVNPDLVADALNLPYEVGTVDEIYAGHLLEHLTWDEGQKALGHWLDLLKKGGIVRITVPDFDVLARKYLSNPTAEAMRIMNELYIYSYCQESHHRYCYGEALLKAAMTEAGFIGLEKVPLNHPYLTSSMDDNQISFKGVK
jgi:GT2 family glycosyltransferase/predicted SAM-dependent methyltransferase